jgi:hypothetical protein
MVAKFFDFSLLPLQCDRERAQMIIKCNIVPLNPAWRKSFSGVGHVSV